MRARLTTWVAWGAMLCCAAVVSAQESPPAEYVRAMQDIEAAMQTLSGFSEAQDYEAQDYEVASAAAASAVAAFEYSREFWSDPSSEAGELAQAAWAAALSAEVAADFSSTEGLVFAVREMGETCMPCHTAHRDQLEDGNFVVK